VILFQPSAPVKETLVSAEDEANKEGRICSVPVEARLVDILRHALVL